MRAHVGTRNLQARGDPRVGITVEKTQYLDLQKTAAAFAVD